MAEIEKTWEQVGGEGGAVATAEEVAELGALGRGAEEGASEWSCKHQPSFSQKTRYVSQKPDTAEQIHLSQISSTVSELHSASLTHPAAALSSSLAVARVVPCSASTRRNRDETRRSAQGVEPFTPLFLTREKSDAIFGGPIPPCLNWA
jgi:hypothetical protein